MLYVVYIICSDGKKYFRRVFNFSSNGPKLFLSWVWYSGNIVNEEELWITDTQWSFVVYFFYVLMRNLFIKTCQFLRQRRAKRDPKEDFERSHSGFTGDVTHALHLHTFYTQNSQAPCLLSERVLGFLSCSCKEEGCFLFAATCGFIQWFSHFFKEFLTDAN